MTTRPYLIGLEQFKVENCRSKGDHNDSDWLTVTVTAGLTMFPTQTKLIGGNLHAGDQIDSVFVGPVDIDDDKFVTVTYTVTNLSHSDDQEEEARLVALKVGAAALEALEDLASAGFAGLNPSELEQGIVAAVSASFEGIAELLGWKPSDPNCNGEIFTRSILFPPGELAQRRIVLIGPNLETATSPSDCGNAPHSTVTYAIRRVDPPTQPHSGNFIQSNFGKQGNFELVVPVGGRLVHFFRANDEPGAPWHRSAEIPQSDNAKAVAMVQSNFLLPGNLEVVARLSTVNNRDRLTFFFRDATGWHGPSDIIADGHPITDEIGDLGNPALIQSNFGKQGNFELVVPIGNRFSHYFRDNDAPGTPWHGPFDFFIDTTFRSGTAVYELSLIQSNFVTPGNLELVARVSLADPLVFFFRDESGWHGPSNIIADGNPITGVSGRPALIQSNFGKQGNFELVVPIGNQLMHYFRDNDAPGTPWHGPFLIHNFTITSSSGQVAPIPVQPTAVSLVQSNFVIPGNLELIVRLSPTLGEDRLVFFFRDSTGWHGPFDVVADGHLINGVAGF